MPETGPIHIQVAGRTDVGLIREHNEDNLLVLDLDRRKPEPLDAGARAIDLGARGALLLVCDGMGGAAAGEVASEMAIETVSAYMLERTAHAPPEDGVSTEVRFARGLRQAAFEANRRIFTASRNDDDHAGMGTTMTTVGVIGHHLVLAQVGDSRAYVLRGGRLVQVTRDQSLVNQLVETGQISEEEAKMFEHSNVILQALGVQEDVEVLLSTVPLRQGDRVIVCTDGLTGVVTDEELAAVLGSGDDMDEVCRLLVEMARAGGGPDNITVVAAAVEGDSLPAPGGDDEVRYERWRLDEPAEPPRPAAHPHDGSWPAVRPPVPDPARTFFSLMLLLAIALGGLVVATQMRRGGGVVSCEVTGPPGCAVHIDGRDVGHRTRIDPIGIRLLPGRYRIGLHGQGAPAGVRVVDVHSAEACRVSFDEGR